MWHIGIYLLYRGLPLLDTELDRISVRLDSQPGDRIRRALASEQRVRLLQTLAERAMNVSEIAANLGLSQPTVSAHVQALEEAGLIECWSASTGKGSEKRCAARFDKITLELGPVSAESGQSQVESAMPVGLFTAMSVRPPCGLASNSRIIGFLDVAQSFLMPERAEAQVLWFGGGWIEYTFPFDLPPAAEVTGLEFVVEIGARAGGPDDRQPSDITVWIEGVQIGTWTSPGGSGGPTGRLSPEWWSDQLSGSGALKSWSVNGQGSFVDGTPAGPSRLADLALAPRQPVVVRIGNRPDAVHAGGVSVFGRRFGNYPQDLVLRVRYQIRSGGHEKAKLGDLAPAGEPIERIA